MISNGADFDDFAGLEYWPNGRFRVTHTGAMFGKRDPRPFLTAFARPISPTRSRGSSGTSARPTGSGSKGWVSGSASSCIRTSVLVAGHSSCSATPT